MAVTEGLHWVIPIKFEPEAKIIPEIEQLMPDFWKFELENKTSYKPIDIKTGKEQYFDLMQFMEKLKPLNTDYAFYLGSESTPPCIGKLKYFISLLR